LFVEAFLGSIHRLRLNNQLGAFVVLRAGESKIFHWIRMVRMTKLCSCPARGIAERSTSEIPAHDIADLGLISIAHGRYSLARRKRIGNYIEITSLFG
jgi:hypothetical protein